MIHSNLGYFFTSHSRPSGDIFSSVRYVLAANIRHDLFKDYISVIKSYLKNYLLWNFSLNGVPIRSIILINYLVDIKNHLAKKDSFYDYRRKDFFFAKFIESTIVSKLLFFWFFARLRNSDRRVAIVTRNWNSLILILRLPALM